MAIVGCCVFTSLGPRQVRCFGSDATICAAKTACWKKGSCRCGQAEDADKHKFFLLPTLNALKSLDCTPDPCRARYGFGQGAGARGASSTQTHAFFGGAIRMVRQRREAGFARSVRAPSVNQSRTKSGLLPLDRHQVDRAPRTPGRAKRGFEGGCAEHFGQAAAAMARPGQ